LIHKQKRNKKVTDSIKTEPYLHGNNMSYITYPLITNCQNAVVQKREINVHNIIIYAPMPMLCSVIIFIHKKLF